MATTYGTEKLIAGDIKTDQAPMAVDTYYRGMPLKYTASSSNYYEYDSSVLATVAIYLGDSVSSSRVIAVSEDRDSIIVFGDIQEAGIVNDSGVAITITNDMIAACATNGLFIKRS